MTRAEFHAAIAEMLDCQPSEVRGDSALRELPNWDSLAVLSFVALADSRFGAVVSGDDLVRCRTVDDLAALLPIEVEP